MIPEQKSQTPRLPPAYRLVSCDRVTSTNDEAKRLADEGAEDGTLIWAREQTAGRGRQGRSWVSPQGNLFCSIVLRPECAVAEAAQLSFVAAVGLGEALGSVVPPLVEVRYKWPNDVLLNGRKVAGILIESKSTTKGALEWLVLGVGVNVIEYPKDAEFPATSLRFEGCGAHVNDVAVLNAFARHFLAWVNAWLESGFEPIRRAWLSHAQGLGEEAVARLPKEEVRGTFKDLDAQGALILSLPGGGERKITAGDVFFG